MELDRELLNQIHAMDDKALSSGIQKIAQNLGVDPMLAKMYLGDTEKVKQAVANLSQEDLNRICQAIGQDNAEKLAREIRREVKGK